MENSEEYYSDSKTETRTDSDAGSSSGSDTERYRDGFDRDEESEYASDDSQNPDPYEESEYYTVKYVLDWIRGEQDYDPEDPHYINYPDFDHENIVAHTEPDDLEEIISDLLAEEIKEKKIEYFTEIKGLIDEGEVEIANIDDVDENLALAVEKDEKEIVEFYVKKGVDTEAGIFAATAADNDDPEMLALLNATVEPEYVTRAVKNKCHDALDYFLRNDFAVAAEIVLALAAKNSDQELVEIVCEHADIEYVYDLIMCLIKNGGEDFIRVFFDKFDIHELLTEVQEQDGNRDLYKLVLNIAENHLQEQGWSAEEIKDLLQLSYQQLDDFSSLLCYPRELFSGNPELKELRRQLDEHMKLDAEQKLAANYIGIGFSTANRYLTSSPYHPHRPKEAEKYFRSDKHPLSVAVTPQVASYKPDASLPETKVQTGYGKAAHLGFYKNTFDSLNAGKKLRLSKRVKIAENSIIEGNAALYRSLLIYKHSICNHVAAKCDFGDTGAIKVGFYNRYPCVMVLIKEQSWTEIAISYFTALVNYKAQWSGLDIELLRRSSFGFLTPTIAPCDESMRISIGVVPLAYADILVECLNILNKVFLILNGSANEFVQRKLDISLPENCFLFSQEYKEYIAGKDRSSSVTNVLQLVTAQIDKAGKTGVYNLMRTVSAHDGLMAVAFQLLYHSNPSSGNEYVRILLDTLRWGFGKICIKSNRLTFQQDFSVEIPKILKEHTVLEDPRFLFIISRIVAAAKKNPSLRNDFFKQHYPAVIIAIEKCVQEKSLTGLYYIVELLNELIYSKAIFLTDVKVDNGYGSESEVEKPLKANRPALYGKKIILHNGMRAILAALHAGADFLSNTYLTTTKKLPLVLYGAYYETTDAMKLISRFNVCQNLNIINQAEIMIYDINACGKHGEKLPIPTAQQLSNIRVLILDSTSATIFQYNSYIEKFLRQPSMQMLFFVSSGFKNEQMGADKNPYGTIRIFTKDKAVLDARMEFIKAKEKPIDSHVSHTYRRMMKDMGNVPCNRVIVNPSAYFKPKKQKIAQQTEKKIAAASASAAATVPK
jgi:hypothetical protein